jgi:hypothetical protein
MNEWLKVLLLEDSRADARLIESCLKTSQLRCAIKWVETLAEADVHLEMVSMSRCLT